MIERHFDLFLNAGKALPLLINVNQFDHGEKWIFTLYNDDGTQYIPSTGAIVGVKSDGYGIINSGSIEDGKVVIMETEQMTAAVGKATFELMIDSQTHGTANFNVLVEAKPGNNATYSDSDVSLIQEAVDATSPLPTGGTVGQVLTKTAQGSAWSDTPTQEQVAEAVSDWADEHITVETGVVIDTSLSVAGAAADAKATGSRLDFVSEALKTGTFTISGANVDSTGKVVSTAAYDLICYRVSTGNPITFTCASTGIYAFFASKPTVGSTSYNSSRSNASANVSVTADIPNNCTWIAIRVAHGASLSAFSMTPYVIGYVDKKVYYLTPEDFGAVGNGSSNDTSAIQAMFDRVAALANTGVVICNGKTGARYLTNTITISTDTYNNKHNISINNMQLSMLGNLMFTASNNNHYGFHFNNCIFNGVKSNSPIFANNYVFTYATFNECVFDSFTNIIYCDVFEQNLTFERCNFLNCDTCFYGTAFYTLKCKNCVFSHCTHILEQAMLNDRVSTYLRFAQEIVFDGCYFDYYQTFAIKLADYSEVIVEKCYFEHGGLDTDGVTHINHRNGIWLYDDANYTRRKGVLIVKDNHFQDTQDASFSPKLVDASQSTFDTIIMRGNAVYNMRFLAVAGATCTGIIEFFGNVLTADNPQVQNIYGDFSSMKLIGYVDGVFYINGSPYGS